MKSLTQHHHHQQQNNLSMGGEGGGGEMARHQQTRQIAWHCRQLAMSTAAQLAHLIKRSAMGGGDGSVAEACESYVTTFQRAFLSHFPHISHREVAAGGGGGGAMNASGALRKNQSDSNFAATLAHFKLDEAWTKGSGNNVNAADNNNRNNNKKKGWCSRLSYFATTAASGKNPQHHADADVSPDEVTCDVDDDAFADSSLSTESINSLGGVSTKTTSTTISSGNSKLHHQHSNKNLWNRIRRASKSSKISEEEETPVKVTAVCELRINSSNTQHQQLQNNFSPFLKSRIVLRSQESDGYQFVIFTPAKSSKPKYVINGTDVTEVRPTEASTNYHSRHCFVLKSHDYEVVVKLECWEDVLVWLNEIEDAHMKIDSPNSNIYVCHKTHYTPRFLRNQQQPTSIDHSDTVSTSKKSKKSSLARLRSGGSSSCAKLLCDDELDETLTTGTDTGEESKKEEVERSAEDYYTRVGVWKATPPGFEPATSSFSTIESSDDVVTGPTMSRCSSSSSGGDVTTITSSTDDGDDKSSLPGEEPLASASRVGGAAVEAASRVGADVTRHPWFHGRMSRSEASDLLRSLRCSVTTEEEEEGGGTEGAAPATVAAAMPREGTFLLRYSSNQRCHVITIVCRKQHYQHLRMAVDREGRCRINNRCFSSVVDMLHHFHRHPISMDSANRVILTDFVINRSRFTGNGGTESRLEPVENGGGGGVGREGTASSSGKQVSSSSGPDHHRMAR